MPNKLLILLSSLLTVVFAYKFSSLTSQDHLHIDGNLGIRLPNFIGTGYHALNGNPFSSMTDPGFRAPIYNLTYSENKKTQDNIYQIPDISTSRINISCSFSPKIKIYRGNENYQKQLQTISHFDNKFNATVMKSKFSLSSTFQILTNNTISKNLTIIQTNAQCNVYTLEIPIYNSSITLQENFVFAVKQSYNSQNWRQFIDYFGSHFVYSITYGARYIVENTYSQNTMSYFAALNLNLDYNAQIQFYQNAGIPLTEELRPYENEARYQSSKSEHQQSKTYGALPPKTGSLNDWINATKLSLAPLYYKSAAITVLFNYISGLDTNQAIKSFQSYFNNYCDIVACPKIITDRPSAKPIIPIFVKTQQIQGQTKSDTQYDTNNRKIQVSMKVVQISLGISDNLDSIEFLLSNTLRNLTLTPIGEGTPTHRYIVPNNDEIKCIKFGVHRSVKYIRFSSIQFSTAKGSQSQIYKGKINASQFRTLCKNSTDDHLVGFFGRYNAEEKTFDSIGLNLMKEIIQN